MDFQWCRKGTLRPPKAVPEAIERTSKGSHVTTAKAMMRRSTRSAGGLKEPHPQRHLVQRSSQNEREILWLAWELRRYCSWVSLPFTEFAWEKHVTGRLNWVRLTRYFLRSSRW